MRLFFEKYNGDRLFHITDKGREELKREWELKKEPEPFYSYIPFVTEIATGKVGVFTFKPLTPEEENKLKNSVENFISSLPVKGTVRVDIVVKPETIKSEKQSLTTKPVGVYTLTIKSKEEKE